MNPLPLSTETTIETQELVVMEPEPLPERPMKEKAIIAGILAAVALVSLLVVANIASNPATYSSITDTLDEKKGNVMMLATTTTAASAALARTGKAAALRYAFPAPIPPARAPVLGGV